MFRGRITRLLGMGLLGFVMLGLCVSTAVAQSARQTESKGPSLVDRLSGLRKKFLKEDKQPPASIAPRKTRAEILSEIRTVPRSKPKSAKRSGLPRIQVGDLLPKGLFGKSGSTESVVMEALPRSSSSRAGSAARPSKRVRTASRAPIVKRPLETKSAPADLSEVVANDSIIGPIEHPSSEPTAIPLPHFLKNSPEVEPAKKPAQHTRKELHAGRRKTTSQAAIDLRNSLLGEDLEDLMAEEVVDSTAVSNPPEPVLPKPKTIKLTPSKPQKSVKRDAQLNPSSNTLSPIVSSTAPKNSLREVPADRTGNRNAENKNIDRDSTNEKAMQAFSGAKLPSRSASQADTNNANDTNEDLLLTYREPVIVSRVEGPRKILVGREANYRVTLQNTSQQSAKELNATIRVPAWVDLVDVMSSRGVVQRISTDDKENVLQWKLHELEPDSSQTLRLRLIPRSGRALQLGVRWSQAAVGSETVVEVQEPKLHMTIGGPSQVLFGKAQRYRLSLNNPGTGVAENVVIHLIPPGGKPEAALKHVVGSLAPGEAKEIELELTAQEAGELVMQATAIAEGGIQSKATKQVLCRKPELKLDWRGPDKKYAGTVATYFFRLRNPGTAKTEPLQVKLQLPEQAKLVSASEGHEFDTRRSLVTWDVIGLSPKEERFLQVRCHIDQAGANRLKITAQNKTGDLTATQSIQTEVIALADLKLSVSDPRGPVAVGEPAEYVIRVRNHGTTGAENVHVAALFSEGIEPTSVEGAQYTLRDGRVTFQPIKSLAAGAEIVLRIRAEAARAGNHIFRTEVFCSELDIKLSAEETTRFFVDNHRWEEGETPYSAERNETTNR